MKKVLYKLLVWLYDRQSSLQKRLFVKYILGTLNDLKHAPPTKLHILKDQLLEEYKNQEIERLKRMFVYKRHAKIRIAQRFGHLSTNDILSDIQANYVTITVNKDMSFKIQTLKNSYVFSKDYCLITTYPNDRQAVKGNITFTHSQH